MEMTTFDIIIVVLSIIFWMTIWNRINRIVKATELQNFYTRVIIKAIKPDVKLPDKVPWSGGV